MPHTVQKNENGFYGLGIAPALLEMLEQLGFKTPTPIQKQAIPIAIEGKDVAGIAQTGTGKTLAFGLPMIQRIAEGKGQGLIVLPTRELALQVDEMVSKMGRGINLKTAVLIGGASFGPQVSALSRSPHVIIATPGRLIDHLNRGRLKLDRVHIVVLDEADRMLDMGFLPQIKKIFAAVPKERQTMLFSATMPSEIMNLASSYMKLPVRIEIARPGTTAENVNQELFIVTKEGKSKLLLKLLQTYNGPTLVFTRTKYGAQKVARDIRTANFRSVEIHSNRSLGQRKEAMQGFKSGKYRVLVATDIASRGIDVFGIELVINYDLPGTSDDYVHRIGRTARAGAAGHAITFAMPSEGREVRGIERLTGKPLKVVQHPDILPMSFEESRGFGGAPRRSYYGGGRSSGGRSGSGRSGGRGGYGGRSERSSVGRSGGYGHNSRSVRHGSPHGARPSSSGGHSPRRGGRPFRR